jgi:hypothetical protein
MPTPRVGVCLVVTKLTGGTPDVQPAGRGRRRPGAGAPCSQPRGLSGVVAAGAGVAGAELAVHRAAGPVVVAFVTQHVRHACQEIQQAAVRASGDSLAPRRSVASFHFPWPRVRHSQAGGLLGSAKRQSGAPGVRPIFLAVDRISVSVRVSCCVWACCICVLPYPHALCLGCVDRLGCAAGAGVERRPRAAQADVLAAAAGLRAAQQRAKVFSSGLFPLLS